MGIAARILAVATVRRVAAVLTLSAVGAAGIVVNEGDIRKVYLDPVGIPTACAGHTGPDLPKVGTIVSEDYCIKVLASDTAAAQSAVRKLVKVPITQNQYDALVDFTFNVGTSNFAKSTLLRKANAGDCLGAGAEFPKWNTARGRVLPGLVKRRAWEAGLWTSGC